MEEKVYKVMGGAGAMNIVLGVVMLVRPDVALQSLCLLAGILLCVMGAIKAVVFFVNKNGDKTPALLILGIVQLLLGIALIVKPGLFLQIFQFVNSIRCIFFQESVENCPTFIWKFFQSIRFFRGLCTLLPRF